MRTVAWYEQQYPLSMTHVSYGLSQQQLQLSSCLWVRCSAWNVKAGRKRFFVRDLDSIGKRTIFFSHIDDSFVSLSSHSNDKLKIIVFSVRVLKSTYDELRTETKRLNSPILRLMVIWLGDSIARSEIFFVRILLYFVMIMLWKAKFYEGMETMYQLLICILALKVLKDSLVRIPLNYNCFYLMLVYKFPNPVSERYLCARNFLLINYQKKKLSIVGDFSFLYIGWASHRVAKSSKSINELTKKGNILGLIPVNNEHLVECDSMF